MRSARRPFAVGFLVCLAILASDAVLGAEDAAARTQWFRDAKWGVFTHYLTADTMTPDEWNKTVGSFDVTRLATDVASTGAGYYVITLGQNSGHYCTPNATYDSIVGITPSKCAKRDLIAELYDALHAKGIRLMVYLPAGAPDRDPVAMKALEWKNGKYPIWKYPEGGPDGGDDRLVNFQRKWESVIREWSVRWGDKVSGWWFDGCYFPIAMYKHADAPNFESFAAAARAGNPNSIVAFNPGVRDPIISLSPAEDYTAGEINDADKLVCPGPTVDGRQYHMLSYLGRFWGQAPPRYSDDQVVAITKGITDKGGVVTWDVPIQHDGTIPEVFLQQLRVLGQAMREGAAAK
ncbi:MAG: alpha-L-fucosidase [Candidatus Hydrogenedentes bacterium]|nr:alpha-L-fucosidase [Candidatus Hydrogenedentota bacterium]